MSTNDPEFYQAPKFSPEKIEEPPRSRGCFFYGCIIAVVLALLMVVFVVIMAFVAYRWFGSQVEEYTSPVPDNLPVLNMPEEQRKAVKDRWEAFRKAAAAGTATEPLVLTSDDLNALIEQNSELKGKFYVTVEGDEIKGQISIPLDNLPLPMFKGRYLNGKADVKARLFDGELIVHLDAIEVKGKPFPPELMTELRKQNFAKDITKDKDTAEVLRKIESLEIKDDKIIVKVRPRPAGSGPPATKKAIPVEVVPPKMEPSPKTEPSPNGAPHPKAAPEPATPKKE